MKLASVRLLFLLAFSLLLFSLASAQTVVLPASPAGITDTFIANNGGTRNDAGKSYDYLHLLCSAYSARWCSSRALLKFDLASLQGQQVAGAYLSLYDYKHPFLSFAISENISVHELTADWNLDATLLTKNGTDNWSSTGGDFSASAVDSVPVGLSNEWKTFDITSSVNHYLSIGTNYGWMLRGQGDSIYDAGKDIDVFFRSSRYSDSSFAPKLTVVYNPAPNELDSVRESLGLLAAKQRILGSQLMELQAIKLIYSQSVSELSNADLVLSPGTWVFQPNWTAANSTLDLNLMFPTQKQLFSAFGNDPVSGQSFALKTDASGIVLNRSMELSIASDSRAASSLGPANVVFQHSSVEHGSGEFGPLANSLDPNYYLVEKLSDSHYRLYFDDGFHYEGYAPSGSALAGKIPYYNDGSFDLYLAPNSGADNDGLCSPSETIDSSPIDCYYAKMVLRSQMPKQSEGIRGELSSLRPMFLVIPNQSVLAGNAFSRVDLLNYALENSNNPSSLVFSVVSQSNPSFTNCSVNGNRYLDCSTPVSAGTSTVTLQASNSTGSGQTSFTLQASSGNTAPYWTAIPNQTIVLGNSFSQIDLWNYSRDSTDALSAMSYSVVSQSNSGFSNCVLSSNRYLNCTAPIASGSNTVTVRVTDTSALSADTSFVLTANSNPNNPPEAHNVSVSPSSPVDSDNLNCNYAYYDAENDSEQGTTFSWYENNSILSGQTLQTLNNSLTVVGGQYYCKVQPRAATGTQNLQWYQSANTVTIQSAPVHDVSVSSLAFTTTPLWMNYSNEISALVSNSGNQTETITIRLKADNVEQATQTFTLNSGASETRTFYWNPSAVGNYSVKVSADYLAGETNTINNEAGQSADVLDSINSAVFLVEASAPATAPPSTPFDLSAKVYNKTAKEMKNIPVTLSVVSGSSLTITPPLTKTISSIPANSNVVVVWNSSSTAQTGAQTIKVESINAFSNASVSVLSYAQAIQLTPSNPASANKNTGFTAAITVQNSTAVALANVSVTIAIDGDLSLLEGATKTIPSIPALSSAQLTWSMKTNSSTGAQAFHFTSFDLTANSSIYVQPDAVHDIAVSNLTFSTDPLWINWDNTVSANVSNNGNATENITLHLKANNVEQSSQTFSLNAGASIMKTFTWNPSATGTRTMKVTADAVAGETNTGDNSASQSVNVLDSSNTAIFNVMGQIPGTVPEQTSFDVNAKVTNNTDQIMYNVPVKIEVRAGSYFTINENPTKVIPVIQPNSNAIVTWNVSSMTQTNLQDLKFSSINAFNYESIFVRHYSEIIGVLAFSPGNVTRNTNFVGTGRITNNSDVSLKNVAVTISITGDLTFSDTVYTKIISNISPHSIADVTWNLKTNNSTGWQLFSITSFGITGNEAVFVT